MGNLAISMKGQNNRPMVEKDIVYCKSLMSQINSNIALSMINMNMNREAVEKCKEALELDKTNSKAS